MQPTRPTEFFVSGEGEQSVEIIRGGLLAIENKSEINSSLTHRYNAHIHIDIDMARTLRAYLLSPSAS